MKRETAGTARILLAVTAAVALTISGAAFAAQKDKGQSTPKSVKDPRRVAVGTELTESECTRLGGTVTSDGSPNIPGCSTGLRCKTVGSNGDIHSICIDEAK